MSNIRRIKKDMFRPLVKKADRINKYLKNKGIVLGDLTVDIIAKTENGKTFRSLELVDKQKN